MKKTKDIPRSELSKIKFIRKRTGEVVPFELERITHAVLKAFEVSKEGGELMAEAIAKNVFKNLLDAQADLIKKDKNAKFLPSVEMVQDLVEKELMRSNFVDTAKKYILYRNKRSELRVSRPISKATKKAVEESSKYFSSPYSDK